MITISEECFKRFQQENEFLGNNKAINKIEPLVSVTVATYQHKNYITKCIEGILMQVTDFPFEIIIGEDGSVDGTREICIAFANDHKDKIRLFLRDRKTSQLYDENGTYVTRFNGIWNRMSARGKYIAWCEGDDYWIDPYKLQKQVDFMEKNPDYGMVYTKVKVYNERSMEFEKKEFGQSVKSVEDMLMDNKIPTPSALFRRDMYESYVNDIHPESRNWLMGDYPLWLWLSSKSKLRFMNYASSVYRVLENSAIHTRDLKKVLALIESYYSIKLFYIEYLGLDNAGRKALEMYYKGKVKAFVLYNQEGLSELKREMKELNFISFKNSFLRIIISNSYTARVLSFFLTA